MNELTLLKAFGEIDDRFILEADPEIKKAPLHIWVKFTAACLVLVIISFSAFSMVLKNSRKSSPEPVSSGIFLSSQSQASSQKEESDNLRGEENKTPSLYSSEQSKGEATSSRSSNKKGHQLGSSYYIVLGGKVYRFVSKSNYSLYGFEKIGEEDVGDFLGNIIINKNSGASAPYSPDERNEGAEVYASKQSDDIIYLKNKTTGEYNFYILETLIKK